MFDKARNVQKFRNLLKASDNYTDGQILKKSNEWLICAIKIINIDSELQVKDFFDLDDKSICSLKNDLVKSKYKSTKSDYQVKAPDRPGMIRLASESFMSGFRGGRGIFK